MSRTSCPFSRPKNHRILNKSPHNLSYRAAPLQMESIYTKFISASPLEDHGSQWHVKMPPQQE